MDSPLGFVIRDGLESDIRACLELDHHYETDYVWQMTVSDEPGEWRAAFKTQRLPRTLEAEYPSDEQRLRLALAPDQCFLVVAGKTEPDILAYLTMRRDPVYRLALIQDLVVSRPYRRRRIATRLLNVARRWAQEQGLIQLTIENHTRNYPGIAFCKQAGFVFCGFNDRYFPNQDIAIFFSQSLR
ncbi:MAG: GNAT family N-acetyltransferase [Chloroflexi bacterium]|nr:GNAT family N-acetyltransferase [Chloroflexota bacterium]MDL1882030.1 GNAT family N-acetyltransferase [Anaerolineae bacterium CFX8]GIL13451.1 MAG: hypothetical protein BroJett038_21710 [Chloroflexota bacterium]